MIIKDALNQATQLLKESQITSARLDAEVILMHTIKESKEFLFTYPEQELTNFQEERFFKFIEKRADNCPVAYITKTKSFFDLEFQVNQNVLIPRPDTEILVTESLNLIKETNLKTVTDIGTGSGAIAISIAKNAPETIVTATDISDRALNVTKKNAKINKININLLKGNLLQPIKNKPTELLIANLPYLKKRNTDVPARNATPTCNAMRSISGWHNVAGGLMDTDLHERKANKQEVKNQDITKPLEYEPELALYSGEDGLDAYRQFFSEVGRLKIKPKFILIEHDPEQTEMLETIIKKNLPNSRLETIKNLCGVDRITKITA